MKTSRLHVLCVVPIVVMLCSLSASGQAAQVVTDQDKVEIQELVTGYARALGSCAANDYAELFGENGYFASGFRESGRGPRAPDCHGSERAPMHQRFRRPASDSPGFNSAGVVIRVSAGTVTGRLYLKDGGYYDDVYEKTAPGNWRFKSRVYVLDAKEQR
jgi:hypothetical protein